MTYTVTKKDLDRLTERLEELLEEDLDVRPEYSGRGMYGRDCVGWVHSCPGASFGAALTVALIEAYPNFDQMDKGGKIHLLNMGCPDDLRDLVYFVSGASQDSMGLQTITYWSELTLATEEGS